MWSPFDGALDAFLPGATPAAMFASFLAALLLSGMMAWVYKVSSAEAYEPDIAQAQILLACIMALVLMVVGDSISRAFGAVGILSVIRFRSNVKNSAEAATLLSAVAVGMACGVGMIRLAVAGALFLCLVQVLVAQIFGGMAASEPVAEKKGKKARWPAPAATGDGGHEA